MVFQQPLKCFSMVNNSIVLAYVCALHRDYSINNSEQPFTGWQMLFDKIASIRLDTAILFFFVIVNTGVNKTRNSHSMGFSFCIIPPPSKIIFYAFYALMQ